MAYSYAAPAGTPSLKEMLDIWHQVIKVADPSLDSLATEKSQMPLLLEGQAIGQCMGSALRRITYHYWYHTGEIQAIR